MCVASVFTCLNMSKSVASHAGRWKSMASSPLKTWHCHQPLLSFLSIKKTIVDRKGGVNLVVHIVSSSVQTIVGLDAHDGGHPNPLTWERHFYCHNFRNLVTQPECRWRCGYTSPRKPRTNICADQAVPNNLEHVPTPKNLLWGKPPWIGLALE